jgi:hypothetical protein
MASKYQFMWELVVFSTEQLYMVMSFQLSKRRLVLSGTIIRGTPKTPNLSW